jgi:glycine/D-amino acid oxidase-like deaminating enzyme
VAVAVPGADCIVVGGGLCGMLTAGLLRAAGARVMLLERGRIGAGPPAVEAGLLGLTHPWRDAPAVAALARRGREICPGFLTDLSAFTGIDLRYREGPVLVLDTAERGTALAWAARQENEVWRVEFLHRASHFPAVSGTPHSPIGGALLVSQIPRVHGDAMLRALETGLEIQGVERLEDTPVRGLLRRGGRVCGVVTNAGTVIAEQVVLACGLGVAALLRALGAVPQLHVRVRQLARYRAELSGEGEVIALGEAVLMPSGAGAMLETDAGTEGEEVARRLAAYLPDAGLSPTAMAHPAPGNR